MNDKVVVCLGLCTNTYRYLIGAVIFLLINFQLLASDSKPPDDPILRILNYSSELPKGLLQGRSAAFILVENENPKRTKWKMLAEKAHAIVVETGTDVIGYFNIQDVFSGLEPQKYFAEELVKREVVNLLIFEQSNDGVTLKVTAFNKKPTFIDHGQLAWRAKEAGLPELLGAYKRAVGSSGQQRTNFLMSETPEFFEDVAIIKKQRFEVFNRDLKLDKLAVPVFQHTALPGNGDNLAGEEYEKIRSFQEQWKADTSQLAAIMKAYPFEYGIIGSDFDEKKLRNEGYQFILYSVHTSGKAIHELLNYKHDKNVTDYITIKKGIEKPSLVTIPAHTNVYKYYIKHIYSGEIYLGEGWDAEESWQESLKNHLHGIMEKVK